MRRVLVIEALDNGFVIRVSGDCGAHARTCEHPKCVRRMLDWFLLAPAISDGRQTGTFPMLEAVREESPVPALEKITRDEDLLPTDAMVRQGPVRRADRPIETPDVPVPVMSTTRIMGQTRKSKPKWRGPK